MKYLVNISRLFVGLLFIFSGLIKLNDPVGFSFKLEEYFGPTVFNIDPFLRNDYVYWTVFILLVLLGIILITNFKNNNWRFIKKLCNKIVLILFLLIAILVVILILDVLIIDYVLPIAIIIVVIEVLLGVFLLIGFKKKFTVYSLLIMIVFFTFLTWYSAFFDVVKDCGCFGDAIKLTPWESFSKDVILLVLILFLLKGISHIKPIFNTPFQYVISFASLFSCFLLTYQVLNHLPIIDFRAYKIGANILELRKDCSELKLPCPQEAQLMLLKDRSSGKNIEIYSDSEDYMINWDKYDFQKYIGNPIIRQEGYESPIPDFSMDLNNVDYTDTLMQEEKLLIFVFHDISKIDNDAVVLLKETIKIAMDNDYKICGLTPSGEEDINLFKSESEVEIDFYTSDDKTIKTIVRSNLGALKMHKGTIIEKTHWNDFDDLNLTDH